MNVLQTYDVKITASIQPVAKLSFKIQLSPNESVMIVQKSSKKKCNQPDCQKSNCCYVHKTLMSTSNDVMNHKPLRNGGET